MKTEDFVVLPHPFLSGMCEAHLHTLAAAAMKVHFAPKQFVFREGDIANRFYLIHDGKVQIQTRIGGRIVPVQTVGAGDVLGWSWLFPPYSWHFDAWVLENTEAIFFYATRLREDCESDKWLGYDLMKRVAEVVIRRLQATRHKLVEAAISEEPIALPF